MNINRHLEWHTLTEISERNRDNLTENQHTCIAILVELILVKLQTKKWNLTDQDPVISGSSIANFIAERKEEKNLRYFVSYVRRVFGFHETNNAVANFLRETVRFSPNTDITFYIKEPYKSEVVLQFLDELLADLESKVPWLLKYISVDRLELRNGVYYLNINNNTVGRITDGLNILFLPSSAVHDNRRLQVSSRHDASRALPFYTTSHKGKKELNVGVADIREQTFNETDTLTFLENKSVQTVEGIARLSRALRVNAHYPNKDTKDDSLLLSERELNRFASWYVQRVKAGIDHPSAQTQSEIANELFLTFFYNPSRLIKTLELLDISLQEIGGITSIFPFIPLQTLVAEKETVTSALNKITQVPLKEHPKQRIDELLGLENGQVSHTSDLSPLEQTAQTGIFYLDDFIRKIMTGNSNTGQLQQLYGNEIQQLRSEVPYLDDQIQAMFFLDGIETLSWWLKDFWLVAYLYLLFLIRPLESDSV